MMPCLLPHPHPQWVCHPHPHPQWVSPSHPRPLRAFPPHPRPSPPPCGGQSPNHQCCATAGEEEEAGEHLDNTIVTMETGEHLDNTIVTMETGEHLDNTIVTMETGEHLDNTIVTTGGKQITTCKYRGSLQPLSANQLNTAVTSIQLNHSNAVILGTW